MAARPPSHGLARLRDASHAGGDRISRGVIRRGSVGTGMRRRRQGSCMMSGLAVLPRRRRLDRLNALAPMQQPFLDGEGHPAGREDAESLDDPPRHGIEGKCKIA